MTKSNFRPADKTSFVLGTALLAVLTGCVSEQPGPQAGYRGPPGPPPRVQVQATLAFHDDYDYYPRYETYYSRNRREFVYREGNTWVRRSEPRGVAVAVLLAAPTVRVDFHDSPEHHHSTVVQSYPRNWAPPGVRVEVRDPRRDERPINPRDNARVAPAIVVVQDDYDYYPAHEVYYSRTRREYVYREGNSWVRRPEPRDVKLEVLIATPSVRVEFHDSPEQHHSTVVQKYPKHWKHGDKHDDKDDRKDDKKDK